MSRSTRCFAVLLFLCAFTCAWAAPISNSDFLKAKGRNLRKNKGTGEVVQLKGTNLGGWLIQEFWMTCTNNTANVNDEQSIYNVLTTRFGSESMETLVNHYQDDYITEADFDNMANMGMNCVRLPFWWRNIANADGTLKANWSARLDWAVAQAKARGMYVVIDFHGAPGSQNGSDHSGVDGGNDKIGASNFFFGDNNVSNQMLYYDLWEAVAKHFKDEPAVAGYDLLNEPYCTYRYNSPYTADQLHTWLWNIYNMAYQRIRTVDPDHVIIMEATWDPVDLPNPSTYNWTNVMYEYHNYEYSDYDNNEGKQISSMRNKLQGLINAAYDVPSYMGEFCYFNNTDAWDAGLELLNNTGINWTTWTYKVISTYGNWGLANHSNTGANVETDSYDDLYNKWSRPTQWNNTNLIDVCSKYFKKAAVKNNMGPEESDEPISYESVTATIYDIASTTASNLAGWTRYEGESAYIKGGQVESQSFYSGGAGVGSLNNSVAANEVASDWNNINYVRFSVNVPAAGRYRVLLQYNGDDDKTIMVKSDAASIIARIPTASSDRAWNRVHVALIEVPLKTGNNDLYISGTVGNINTWLNVDCIDICRIPVSYTSNAVRYEAEYGVIKPNREVGEEQQSFYSNGWGVGGLGSDVALDNVNNDLSNVYYVQFPIFAETSGAYTITLAYNGNGASMTAKYRLNNGTATTYVMNNQGKNWDNMNYVNLNVNLNAGMNSITVAGSSTGSWNDWVNFDYIDVTAAVPTSTTDATTNEPTIYTTEDGIIIETAEPEDFTIMNLTGNMVANVKAEGRTMCPLTPGLYIIKSQKNCVKVLVF